jgi:hypothetical protein
MPPRNRTPIYFGDGLDRESGLMVTQPTSFQDLRNVLLHEGRLLLRDGFLPSGTGEFPEVDQLLAGEPLRSQAIGIVVGYNSSTRRVYVYRVSPDLSIVELVGEWEHDLAGGWGNETPVIHMAEVFGRVFIAHDAPFVSRRAATIYYDPSSTGDLLNFLTATWAGTAGGGAESAESGESAESAESVSVVGAIRFRGVVRHLAYLVGWGFGTASEIRPELVRISLPGEPTMFEQNHYFIAGDRSNAVLACGASGAAPDQSGGILNVWKRNETHAIYGYDRRTFGIRQIDARYGIIAGRAWVNVDGTAVAWSEEGPRAWSGLGPSTQLETPLALEDWEPIDLVDETESKFAYAFFVPRIRQAWFVFGQRVYALTARIPGRWRWSYHTLGFPTYGGMVFFASTEGSFAPPGYPSCDELTAAGSYIDIDVGNHNQVGDEIIEVWLSEHNSGSGNTETSGNHIRGWTDFSEFAVQEATTPPSGITFSFNIRGSVTTTQGIENDPSEGNVFYSRHTPTNDGFNHPRGLTWKFDAWDSVKDHPGLADDTIEFLARIYTGSAPGLGSNGRGLSACYAITIPDGNYDGQPGFRGQGFAIEEVSGPAFGLFDRRIQSNGSGQSTDENPFTPAVGAVANNQWRWCRTRYTRNSGTGKLERRFKSWTGDLADEPVAWDFETTAATESEPDIGLGEIGWGLLGNNVFSNDQRIAYLAFTTDPTGFPAVEEATTEHTEWTLVKSVPVSALSSQTIRIDGLDNGQEYHIALRYRRGLLYNAGADAEDPHDWPSISLCIDTTTIDPPTVNSATWSRVDGTTEQIEVDITPLAGSESEDIEVWRAPELGNGEPGTPSLIATVSGPHVGDIQYQDQTISGEQAYYYYAVTSASVDSPLSDPVRAWAGPAAIPVFSYFFFGSNNYTVGFTTDDETLQTELWDNMNDAASPGFPALTTMGLRVTNAAADLEIERTTSFDELDDFEWLYKMRHKQTSFAVDDYGEFGPNLVGDFPEGGFG